MEVLALFELLRPFMTTLSLLEFVSFVIYLYFYGVYAISLPDPLTKDTARVVRSSFTHITRLAPAWDCAPARILIFPLLSAVSQGSAPEIAY